MPVMLRLSLFAVLLVSAAPVLAGSDDQADVQHGVVDAQIIVSAPYARDRRLVASAVSVLQGDDLQRQLAALRATPATWIADERFESASSVVLGAILQRHAAIYEPTQKCTCT